MTAPRMRLSTLLVVIVLSGVTIGLLMPVQRGEGYPDRKWRRAMQATSQEGIPPLEIDDDDHAAQYRYRKAYDLAREWRDAGALGRSYTGKVKVWRSSGLSLNDALRKSGLDPANPAVQAGVEHFEAKRHPRW